MPRPPRDIEPGGIYHVTSRGNRRQTIYVIDEDYRCFLRLLARVVRKRGWEPWAYCLMPNHYHLVATTPNGDLSQGMHWVNGVYARWFNDTHGFDGHLFQDRFGAVRVESDRHLLEGIAYVVLNPVRAGLCRHPGDWPWSSYRAMAGMDEQPSLFDFRPALRLFGRDLAVARAAFRAFVDERRGRRGT